MSNKEQMNGGIVFIIYLAALSRRRKILFRFSPLILQNHTRCCECHVDVFSVPLSLEDEVFFY